MSSEILPKPSMSPEAAVNQLTLWYELKSKLTELRGSEAALRRMLYAYYFPQPREGTNRVDIGFGMDLLLDFDVSRKVDAALLDDQLTNLRKAKVKVDELFIYKPTLVMEQYRALTNEQRLLVDACLDIDDTGLQSLSIVPAKKREVQPAQLAALAPPLPAAIAPPVPAPEPEPVTLTEQAGDFTLEQFLASGWDIPTLVQHGYAIVNTPAPQPPRKKPGRPKGSTKKKGK